MSKKKVIIGLIGIGILGLVGNEIYTFHKEGDSKSSSIVSNDKYIDKNNEYIINPNIEMLKEFEWATWRDSAGGRLSRDSTWFIEPSDKYKSQEISFNWGLVKNKTALEKRSAYFNHLCNTEASSYITKDIPERIIKNPYSSEYSLYTIRKNEHPIKDMDNFLESYPFDGNPNTHREKRTNLVNKIFYAAQQNPYLFPNPGFYEFEEGKIIDFSLRELNSSEIEKYDTIPRYGPQKDTFREYMDQKGDIYRIRYDFVSKRYLPTIKVAKSEAEYYTIFREIERPEMKKLGIYGMENIWVRASDKKIVRYYKTFLVPSYLDSVRESNFTIPINWRGVSGCNKNEINTPRMLNGIDNLQN